MGLIIVASGFNPEKRNASKTTRRIHKGRLKRKRPMHRKIREAPLIP